MTRRKPAIVEREVATPPAAYSDVALGVERVLGGTAVAGGATVETARPTRIVVQLPPALAARIHEQAEAEFRTPAQQCAYLLTRALSGGSAAATPSVTKSAQRSNGRPPLEPEDEAGPFPVYHVGEGCCGRVAFLSVKRLRPGVDQVDDATFVTLGGEAIALDGSLPVCGTCGKPVTAQTARFEEPD